MAKFLNKLYRSCHFEQKSSVTSIFFRTALGNQFLNREQIYQLICWHRSLYPSRPMFSLEADREEAEEGVDDEGVHAEIRSVVIS